MRLTQRLLLGALVVVGVHVLVMVLLVNRQLGLRLHDEAVDALTREARAVTAHWTPGSDAPAIAHTDGAAFGHRVTLINADGVVIGDTDFDREGLTHLENHNKRPEVVVARSGGVGVATRPSPSRGDEELYVAVGSANGVVRVSMPAFALTATVQQAQRAVEFAGLVALAAALLVAWALSRTLVRPLVELRDVAGSIAAGDLARRASFDAPGELGELGLSLGELSSQLAARGAARDAYETLLVQLIESLNEGVVGIDSGRMVVRVNDTARRLLRLTDALPFSADLLPRDRVLRDALEGAFEGGVTEGTETVIHDRTLGISARPLGTGGAVIALLDLTRVRRLEAVRRDFVANVSHELRTPLTVATGFAETLLEDELPAEQRRQFAERILFNTRRMQRLVDDLLDLSRIESGGWVPNPVDVELGAAAAETFTAARDTAARKGVALTTEVDPATPTAYADATALQQVLGNLVDNALRHTTTGRVTIFARPAVGGGVEVGVRDTGAGIAAEHLPRIFERFYRVDAARSREEGGTGLGLAIVRHLVEAHGGRVRGESVVGSGTSITATFPAHR